MYILITYFLLLLQILCCLLLAVAFVSTTPIDSDPTDPKKRDDIPSIGDPDNFMMLKLLKIRFLVGSLVGSIL